MKIVKTFYFPGESTERYQYTSLNDNKIVPLIQNKCYKEAHDLLQQLLDISNSQLNAADHKIISVQAQNHNFLDFNIAKIAKGQSEGNSHFFVHKIIFLCYFTLQLQYYLLEVFQQICRHNLKATSIDSILKSLEYLEVVMRRNTSLEIKIFLKAQTIKIGLQYCVLLSQVSDHQTSEAKAKEVISEIQYLYSLLQQLIEKLRNQLDIGTSKQKNNKQRVRNYKLKLISQSQIKIKELKNIYQATFLKNEGFSKIDGQTKQLIENLYSWENVVENNQKFMKKIFGVPLIDAQERNALGLSKIPEWIQQFNIGSLMVFKPKYITLEDSLDPFYLLSNNKILQLTVYASASLFTASTEMRFLKNTTIFQGISASKKYLQMNEDTDIFYCKMLHIKAIEIAVKCIPSANRYINHLIYSFNKNYKFFMEKIEQEANSKLLEYLDGLQEDSTLQNNKEKCENNESTSKTKSMKSKKSQNKSQKSLNKSKKSQNSTQKNNKSKGKQQKNEKSSNLQSPKTFNQSKKRFYRSSDKMKFSKYKIQAKDRASKQKINSLTYAKYQHQK